MMAATISTDLQIINKPFLPSELGRRRTPCFFFCYRPVATFSGRISVSSSSVGDERSISCSVRCLRATNSQSEDVAVPDEMKRPPFDINLAVILAGFAFEAYYTPPENVGRHEIDAAGCKTVYLSRSFLREIYDGQLFIKLKKGSSFPAMDPWGTSDPYVVMQWGGQVVKSKVKWGQKNPTWNEEFTLNIKLPPSETLQVAAWDANLVTPHKRMGYTGINVEGLCDGSLHELLVELEGIGGGGQILLEIKYKSFGEIDDEKVWWRIPFFLDFLRKNGLESAFKVLDGSETVRARQFVQYAFGQLKSFNDAYLQKRWFSVSKQETDRYEQYDDPSDEADTPLALDNGTEVSSGVGSDWKKNLTESKFDNDGMDSDSVSMMRQAGDAAESSSSFWKNFADVINQNVVQKLGISAPDQLKWDVFDLLNRSGLQSTRVAEAQYIESGLATPRSQEVVDVDSRESSLLNISKIQSSLPDVKKATEDLMRQTDSIFGALVILAASVPQLKKNSHNVQASKTEEGGSTQVDEESADDIMSNKYTGLDEKRAEDMKALFSTAESAMEAWAMLAMSLGQPSFIKSEFEKLCFLDNSSTDTQVALWRDCMQKRLVVAFRGTEQTRWKDLRTDLMLAPAGLNPERIGGDFKQEVQVHSGFLAAYDSVRTRIISLIQLAIGYRVDDAEIQTKWHVYVTGHSLGGALATLLALELSSSQMAKTRAISITMYNFGSPRVGNRRFAEIYNEKVMDSWRVVNHRDIIPTVPRLMGYCHVAQPIYLATGDLRNALENMELLDDGYQSDVIGESTPDVLVSEFMKGEKELVEKLLQTEINIFRSIRDGSALMQHMEDFYYITLLENVRSKYQTSSVEQSIDDGLSSS